MALVLKDRVKVTTTTTGTGTLTLGSASQGFQDFSTIGDGNTTYYTIQDPATGAWEVGIGTYTASGTTLARNTVLSSSNSGALVSLAAGSKFVFVTYPSQTSVEQSDIGTAPNEIPLNQYLGSLAYIDGPNGDLVGTTDTQTLTNKTIAFGSNTLTDVASTDTAQTFTNKTLTSPAINTPTITGTKETRVAMAASDIDLSAGNYFTKTISGATTLTVSNTASSGSVSAFILDLTNGGSAAVTFFAGVTWTGGTPPTLTASGRDVLGFFTHDGGTTWSGFVLGLGMA